MTRVLVAQLGLIMDLHALSTAFEGCSCFAASVFHPSRCLPPRAPPSQSSPQKCLLAGAFLSTSFLLMALSIDLI